MHESKDSLWKKVDGDRYSGKLKQKLSSCRFAGLTYILLNHSTILIMKEKYSISGDNGGDSLEHILNRGPLPLAETLELAIAIMDIIGAIHKRCMIHNNLNPSGIIWSKEAKKT